MNSRPLPPPARPTAVERPGNLTRAQKLLLLAISCNALATGIDLGAVNLGYPTLVESFHSDLNVVGWLSLVYILTSCSLASIFGKLADQRGERLLYQLGFGAFAAGAVAVALAPSFPIALLGRGVEGVGTAMIVSSGIRLIPTRFEGKRGLALGVWELAVSAASAIGPLVAGFLMSAGLWRGIFLLPVPICLAGIIVVRVVVTDEEPRAVRPQFDLAGAFLFAFGMVTLLLGITGSAAPEWRGWPVVALLALSLVALAAFVRVERRSANPMIQVALLTNRLFAAANLAKVFVYSLLFVVIVITPFYLQAVVGLRPDQIGLAMLAFPAGLALTSLPSGHVADRFGSAVIVPVGLAIALLGAIGLYLVSAETPVQLSVGAVFVVCFGLGLFIPPNDSSVLARVPRAMGGVAGGLLATARMVGQMCGLAIAGGLFSSRLAVHLTELPDRSAATMAAFHDVCGAGIALAISALLMCVVGWEAKPASTAPAAPVMAAPSKA